MWRRGVDCATTDYKHIVGETGDLVHPFSAKGEKEAQRYGIFADRD